MAARKRTSKRKQGKKDPAAVKLGRKGGLKGGKARWQGVPKEERSAYMRELVRKRWSGRQPPP
jgi:hypothetical protein